MATTAVTTKAATKAAPKVIPDSPAKKHAHKARLLLENIGETWFEFDQLIAKIYDNNEWEAMGYEKGKEGFEKYCHAELHYSYRSVMNRVGTGHAIMNHGLAKEDLAELGWTKFMEISSMLGDDTTKAEVKHIVAKAKKMSVEELRTFKRESRKTREGGEVVERVTFKLRLLRDQADMLQAYLELALESYGLDGLAMSDDNKLGMALLSIATDWFAGRSEDAAAVKKYQKALAKQIEAATENAEDEPGEGASGAAAKSPRKKRADAGKSRKAAAPPAAAPDVDDADEDDDDDDDGEDDDLDL